MKYLRIIRNNIKDSLKSVFRNFSLSIASISCITITLILVAVAVLLLVGIIGTGIYQNRIQLPGIERMIETFFESAAPTAGVPEIILPR